ncbi:hypothetical protein ml_224 [Mollivirus sibericum]|uniref:hypothetical protein n=1 Tax=Mollivirus sibericum TaxID=1678078 RepID=UPI0006B2DB2C|nr:hypothetical protein ml_224 [Mollivirus sibericum]ALD62026.1 hypothetical protein ml_224 [Mollivirus sibericum]
MTELTIYLNAAQQSVPLGNSTGRLSLPKDAVEATVSAYSLAPDGSTQPVVFGVDKVLGSDKATAVVTKDGKTYAGRLVQLDASTATVLLDEGVTVPVEDYDNVSVERQNGPVVSIGSSDGVDHRVSFLRRGVSWTPSYHIYLDALGDYNADAEDEDYDPLMPSAAIQPPIRFIQAYALISNTTQRSFDLASLACIPSTVALPEPEPEARVYYEERSASTKSRAPSMVRAAAAAPSPMAYSMAQSVLADADSEGDYPEKETSLVGGATRYSIPSGKLEMINSVKIPLFVVDDIPTQESLYFHDLGQDETWYGYRLVVGTFLPAGKAVIFDSNMVYSGSAKIKDTAPMESMDLRVGASRDIRIESTVESSTGYRPAGGAGKGSNIVSIIENVKIRASTFNSSNDSVPVALFYRLPQGVVVEEAHPKTGPRRNGKVEWRWQVHPGPAEVELNLSLYKGQRTVPKDGASDSDFYTAY